jgi:hypothetical protein
MCRFESCSGHANSGTLAIGSPVRSRHSKEYIMAITALKALAKVINEGEAKKPLREFAEELKALSHEEKEELGKLAADVLGEEFTPTAAK